MLLILTFNIGNAKILLKPGAHDIALSVYQFTASIISSEQDLEC